ncbi:MAG: pyruvate kinase [Candidatus Omnitrophica bacterium]|nr:pyruvate kinase [Candidatus Omnitrophota bacterium]
MKQYWNNTKVICTIGPACKDHKTLRKMILSGMDVARFNFSHGKPQEHVKQIKSLRTIAERLRMPVAIMQDLPGPKIRIGALKDEFIELVEGKHFFLTTRKIVGTSDGVSVDHATFVKGLKKNDTVYLNDGLVKLTVISTGEEKVICSVVCGGRIYPKKGVSCPDRMLKLSPVTPQDLKYLKYGIEAGVYFIALSFVQIAEDIIKVKNFIKKHGKSTSVVAKFERKVAIDNMDAIIAASDAVMVARGDLGIEADLKEVPFLQKKIIEKCNALGRPVITATQMLESMVNNPQPTRAEVSDIANAVIDGSDALMLSEETAIGKYPLKTLETMVKIAAKSEEHSKSLPRNVKFITNENENLVDSFSQAAVNIADSICAKAIIVPTNNARGISMLSRRRPQSIVVAITKEKSVFRKLILMWGIYPMLVKKFANLEQTLNDSIKIVRKNRIVEKNDNVVLVLTEDGNLFSSNIMQVRKIKI